MSAGTSSTAPAASQLHAWFDRVRDLTARSVFCVTDHGPHRDAVVLNVLSRNARIVRESQIDTQGALYTPLCLMLAAACERLRLTLGPGHWEAAVANVVSLYGDVARTRRESTSVGLELGSPARLLKDQLDEALLHTGVAGVPSFVDAEGRSIALGLTINWGIRLLCAYALECDSTVAGAPSRQDLGWIKDLLSPLLHSGSPELPAGR